MSSLARYNHNILPSRYLPITQNVINGGFGSVLPVRDTFLDRDVLFKSMHDKNNNAQLLNEIQSLSKARSRHVVEIYDVIFDDQKEVVGIIIEQLTGRDYLGFHAEAKENPSDYLRILYQIATALSDLHSKGVVHRDLKLDNLRESASGLLKLFDFGISTSGVNYRTINNRGTMIYAAPELYIEGAVITTEMDIYAFGICAWALASNTWPPALLERPPQTTNRVLSIESVMSDFLPNEVVQLIDSCLNPDATQRPQACMLSQVLAKHLVRGKHKGIFVEASQPIYTLSNANRNVRLKVGLLGELKVTYDELVFQITEVTGTVFVNNETATVGMVLHESCVLTFGDVTMKSARRWVPFSSSHPEVIL